jgi:hypothetical protein
VDFGDRCFLDDEIRKLLPNSTPHSRGRKAQPKATYDAYRTKTWLVAHGKFSLIGDFG